MILKNHARQPLCLWIGKFFYQTVAANSFNCGVRGYSIMSLCGMKEKFTREYLKHDKWIMNNRRIELCLCERCVADFYESKGYRITRDDPYQVIKDDCSFCQIRRGYD